jgi:hypothetical protein
MTRRNLLLLLGTAIVVGLPVLGHWSRHSSSSDCALDGVKIDPVYRVEIIDAQGTKRAFCCIGCAAIWLSHETAKPQAIIVTDETSRQCLSANDAHYVRSSVVTTPTTGNRIHAFRNLADAEKHAAACGGSLLADSENPFRLELDW